jgi:CBS domain-containing protein
VVPYRTDLAKDGLAAGTHVSSSHDAPIRVAIEVTQLTGYPLLLVEPGGKLVGVVSGRDILRGLSNPAVFAAE